MAIFEPQMQDVLHERLRWKRILPRTSSSRSSSSISAHHRSGDTEPVGRGGPGPLRQSRAGVLMPAQFIPVAEECGQIVKLGRWVLAEACRRGWAGATVSRGVRSAGSGEYPGRHLQHGDLVRDVADALGISKLEPATW